MTDYEGTLCIKCGDKGGYYEGELCVRCNARALGEKCEKCGSPWVYIHAKMSEKKQRVPLCKPCCYSYIKLCGYLDDLPILLKRMNDDWAAEREASMKPAELEAETPESPSGQEFLDI